jgi:glutathione peroxidase
MIQIVISGVSFAKAKDTLMPLLSRLGLTLALAVAAVPLAKAETDAPAFSFPNIDGGTLNTADWRGKPVLVVNTASMCGYTPQYTELQALSDQYEGRAIVLAVPSDDFNQEYATDAEVKEFCELNYSLTLPMATIQHVAEGDVHPLYAWVRDQHGFVPGWNFNKVLLGPDGEFVQAWGSNTKPTSGAITKVMDTLVNG